MEVNSTIPVAEIEVVTSSDSSSSTSGCEDVDSDAEQESEVDGARRPPNENEFSLDAMVKNGKTGIIHLVPDIAPGISESVSVMASFFKRRRSVEGWHRQALQWYTQCRIGPPNVGSVSKGAVSRPGVVEPCWQKGLPWTDLPMCALNFTVMLLLKRSNVGTLVFNGCSCAICHGFDSCSALSTCPLVALRHNVWWFGKPNVGEAMCWAMCQTSS